MQKKNEKQENWSLNGVGILFMFSVETFFNDSKDGNDEGRQKNGR